MQGVVVEYTAHGGAPALGHERGTRTALAKRLAALKDFAFEGEFDPDACYPGPIYFVPSDTLVGAETASRLGIRSERDLYGGVVPYAFVATKAITHPLIETGAVAPVGWSREFGLQVSDCVLTGFTVFTHSDARRAGARLLDRGTLRLKPVRAAGGQGQLVVSSAADLEAALGTLDEAELSRDGLVLEENLSAVTTYSVGHVSAAGLAIAYVGTQRLTVDNGGLDVYGGSELTVTRGGLDALRGFDLSDEVRQAIAQARVYDAAAATCFPGFLASRRNYDVAAGTGADGRRRLGVLEQSWRLGGASSAEIIALEAFRADTTLEAVRATSIEIYGDSAPAPEGATVVFRGVDERIGPITKLAVVERYVDTG